MISFAPMCWLAEKPENLEKWWELFLEKPAWTIIFFSCNVLLQEFFNYCLSKMYRQKLLEVFER